MSDMNSGKPCRRDLLEQINRASFAVDDVKLFLDTHPCDSAALEYFHEYNKIRNQAMREYAKYYGPLTIDTTGGTGSMNHGRGRKDGVSVCGIMKNGCSIR